MIQLHDMLPDIDAKPHHNAVALSNFKFSGRGQRDTPVTDARGAVELIVILPDNSAQYFIDFFLRILSIFCAIFYRFLRILSICTQYFYDPQRIQAFFPSLATRTPSHQ